jgi:hypothetical protein
VSALSSAVAHLILVRPYGALMILPMMGFVLVLFVGGIISGVALYAFSSLRHLSPFAFVPIIASLCALVLCWGIAVGLDRAFASERISGLGFLGGYAVGGLLSAWLGYRFALWLRGRMVVHRL